MRIDVKKYLILGPMSSRDAFFERIQEKGIIEFIHKTQAPLETSPEIQNYIDALHVLRQMVPVKQEPTDDYRSANVLAQHVVEREMELERLHEKVRVLTKEIERIEVFGEFSLSELNDIERDSQRVIQFFFCKMNTETEAVKRPEVIFIQQAHGIDYFMTINRERTTYEGLTEIIIQRSLSDLRQELAEANLSIDIFSTELASLAHKKNLLKQGLYHELNQYHLENAKGNIDALLDGDVFAIEGWIPKNKIADLIKLAEELKLLASPVAVETKDRIPTHLENKGLGRLGEDLIGIYDTPSTSDRDPSLWVFFAFALFFSMIIADAGYGLIMLGISLWLYFKFGRKKGGFVRRFTLLSTYLSIGCIIWGTLIVSFFGIEFAPESKIRKVSIINWMIERKAAYFLQEKPAAYTALLQEYPQLKQAQTPDQLLKGVTRKQEGMAKYTIYSNFQSNVLLELAIFVGAVHIFLAFLRYAPINWSGIGWAIFIVGAYLFFPSILGSVSLIHYVFKVPYAEGALIGKYLVYSGLAIAFVLSVIQNKLKGIAEIMHVVQVFADVMSYLRIYALSLAGMIMASTFNNIAGKLPWILGILIILVGHTLNFTLALMGGVIHGLRLNFIEWYHYSFTGGGKHFKPLSLLKLE
jgi:V/A-type H+/Na+-transporting ATPase subunit I